MLWLSNEYVKRSVITKKHEKRNLTRGEMQFLEVLKVELKVESEQQQAAAAAAAAGDEILKFPRSTKGLARLGTISIAMSITSAHP